MHIKHTHDFLEFIYITDGEGTHHINDMEYPVTAGCTLFVGYQCEHWFKTNTSMTQVNFIIREVPEESTHQKATYGCRRKCFAV